MTPPLYAKIKHHRSSMMRMILPVFTLVIFLMGLVRLEEGNLIQAGYRVVRYLGWYVCFVENETDRFCHDGQGNPLFSAMTSLLAIMMLPASYSRI